MPKYDNYTNHTKGIEVNREDNILKYRSYKDKTKIYLI